MGERSGEEFSLEEITGGREREIGERRGKPEGERSGRGHREEGAEKNQRDGVREEGGGRRGAG